MRASELEYWTISVADRVKRGEPLEDMLVECKGDWPNSSVHTARRLAAHANGAGGEPILWIIGVDEKSQAVPGASKQELSNWISQLLSYMDVPQVELLENLAVPFDGVTLYALRFSTDRAPYLVRLSFPGSGADREVPWRQGNSTRSARHEDLMRVLVPRQYLPVATPLRALLHVTSDGRSADALWVGQLNIDLFLSPRGRERVVLTRHDLEVEIRGAALCTPYELPDALIRPHTRTVSAGTSVKSQQTSPLLQGGIGELILDGPGHATIACDFALEPQAFAEEMGDIEVRATVRCVGMDAPLQIGALLRFDSQQSLGRLGLLRSWSFYDRPPSELSGRGDKAGPPLAVPK